MIHINKLIFLIISLFLLNGCFQSVAVLGPAYSIGATGNLYQAGLSIGSNKMVSKVTGKSTGDHIEEIFGSKNGKSNSEKILKKNKIN